MRSFVISLLFSITILSAQDVAGSYKLSALNVQYYSLARANTTLNAQDTYQMGIVIPIKEFSAGEIVFEIQSGPYTESLLTSAGLNLNIHLFQDGTGTIAEGSKYPDAETVNCITAVQTLPITDVLTYTSNAAAASIIPSTNVAGFPSISTYQGEAAGSFSLSQSVVFDYYPSVPVHPTLCDGTDCFDIILPNGTTIAGGDPLPGYLGGYFLKEGLGGIAVPGCTGADTDADGTPDTPQPSTEPTCLDPAGNGTGTAGTWAGDVGGLTSFLSGNTDPQLYLEWHSIDGPIAESGLGDIIGQDEDGDLTDFDRILGVPNIPAATFNASAPVGSSPLIDCQGYNYPIFGGQTVVDGILAGVNQIATASCTSAGGLGSVGFSQCAALATGAEFAAGCEANGITASITQACINAGGPTTTAEAEAMGIPDDATCAEFAGGYSAYGASQAATACGLTGSPTDATAVACIAACGVDATCSAACVATCQETGPDACGAAIGYASSTSATSLCSVAGSIFDATMTAANVTNCDDAVTGFGIYMQDLWETTCVVKTADSDGVMEVETKETVGYVMDPSGKLDLWGKFFTYNAAMFSQSSAAYLAECGAIPGTNPTDATAGACFAGCGATGLTPTDATAGACFAGCGATGGSPTDAAVQTCVGLCAGDATCQAACVTTCATACVTTCATDCATTCVATAVGATAPALLVNDSDHDFDATCLSDGDFSDCSGRMVMEFSPTCVPQIEMRQVIAEFTDIGSSGTVFGCTDDGSGGANDYNNTTDPNSGVVTELGPDGIAGCNYDQNATIDNNTCYYGSIVSPDAHDCYAAGTCTYDCEGLSSEENIIIDSYSIDSIYPNPFNPIANITFSLPEAGNVLVNVYDITGRVVATLKNDYSTVGTHSINWDASTYPSGLYLLRMESGNFSETHKVVLMK